VSDTKQELPNFDLDMFRPAKAMNRKSNEKQKQGMRCDNIEVNF